MDIKTPYNDVNQSTETQSRNEIRSLILSDLKNFRSNLNSFWGGLGHSLEVFGGNLYGFFLKRGFGTYYRANEEGGSGDSNSLNTIPNDFGRVFVDQYNDRWSLVNGVPTPLAGSHHTPSWVFDIPQYSQKAVFESTGAGIVYNTLGAAFTVGDTITGGTSAAKAKILAIHTDGTSGTLIIRNITGTFTVGEVITDQHTGNATVTTQTYGKINAIFRAYGIGGREVRTDSSNVVFTRWGAFDLFCPMRYFTWDTSYTAASDPETLTCFAQEGFTYVRTGGGTNTFRQYLNSKWNTVGGSPSMAVTTSSRDMTIASGTATYAHNLGTIPKKVQFSAVDVASSYNFSEGAWDGSTNRAVVGGTVSGAVSSYCIDIYQGAGTDHYRGAVTSVDDTNITITWSKVGTPSGTMSFLIQSWS